MSKNSSLSPFVFSMTTHSTTDLPYGEWNFSYHVGDDPKQVQQNRQELVSLLTSQMQAPIKLMSAKQVHGLRILNFDHLSTSSSSNATNEAEGDILVTSHPNIALMIQHADCQAGLIYATSPRTVSGKVIAAVHAGWRGMVQGIYEYLLFYLQSEYLVNMSSVRLYLSPAICARHLLFDDFGTNLPKECQRFIDPSTGGFDLIRAAIKQFNTFGIEKDQMDISGQCTYENGDQFFSYRRANGTPCGRNATVICLKKVL